MQVNIRGTYFTNIVSRTLIYTHTNTAIVFIHWHFDISEMYIRKQIIGITVL